MQIKNYILLILLCAAPALTLGQGIRCTFTLNAQNVSNAGNETFAAMKTSIADFLNSTTWIDQNLQAFEQIECNIILSLNEQTSEYEYKGKLQIQAQRPVYGASYNSVILNAVDNDVEFRYSPNEPLDFSLMSHNPNNITPLLAYWIYMVIAIDGDSFAALGGAEAYRTADRIVQNAQSETKAGWNTTSGSGRKNRYWLTENFQNKRYEKLRRAIYVYHRQGLDLMSGNVDEGKKNILAAIKDVQAVYDEKPDIALYPVALFFDAKADEIVNIFSASPKEEKDELYTLLSRTNVINEGKYKRLKEQQ
jgi:hypothetical protein